MTGSAHVTRCIRRASAFAAAVGAIWGLRHVTSPAVRGWSPPSGTRLRCGPLAVRRVGTGNRGPATVLLHGLTGSGDWFGAAFDDLATHGELIIPDLLGFGGSLDTKRKDFSADAHLDALDEMLNDLELDGCPLTVVGHSMGALLALQWAARRPETIRVVVFCTPLYVDQQEAHHHISGLGLLEKYFAMETPLARWTCAMMCRYRAGFQWISVALSPQWPVHLARQGVLHTWPSYLGGMKGIILAGGWEQALTELDTRGIEVVLAEGSGDPVVVEGGGRHLVARYRSVSWALHARAGHDLPVTHPVWSKTRIVNVRSAATPAQ